MWNIQARYKSDYGRQVRETPFIQFGNHDFIDRPLLKTTSESSAGALRSNTYDKLQLRTSKPHRILSVRANIVTLDEHSIQNVVFKDLVAHVPLLQNDIRHYKKL